MKKILLIVLILSAPALRAQQPAAGNGTEQEKPPQSEQKPAPQPGHPLDPADVDVLTGKGKNTHAPGQRAEVLPYSVGYPINVAQFDARQLGQVGMARGSGLATQVLLGRSRNRSLLGNTPLFLPPPVFFTGRRFTTRGFLFGREPAGFSFRRR